MTTPANSGAGRVAAAVEAGKAVNCYAGRFVGLALATVFGVAALVGWALYDARRDAWAEAVQTSLNLASVLQRDIGRTIGLYDLSLQAVSAGLRMPGISEVSRQIRAGVLFDNAANAPFLGPIRLVDPQGKVILDSTADPPPDIDMGRTEAFRAQKSPTDRGLYIGRPGYEGRTGGWAIALSRRIERGDSSFHGAVIGSLRLDFFRDLVSRLKLGPRDSVALYRLDGVGLMRWPSEQGGFAERVHDVPLLSRIAHAGSGHFEADSPVDGVSRVYGYSRVGDLPLVVFVGIERGQVFAAWRNKAAIIGTGTVLLSVMIVVLAWMLLREFNRRGRAEAELSKANADLATLAALDGLTGLANRRSFGDAMRRAWRGAVRQHGPVSLLLLDIDCFKPFNDLYGHAAGDDCLCAVARVLQSSLRRPGDLAARYGGEEFAVVLPETDQLGARQVAEAIRAGVADLEIRHGDGPAGVVSVSIGVAAAVPLPGDADEPRHLVEAADAALYAAKRAGRNRVEACEVSGSRVLSAWRADYIQPLFSIGTDGGRRG